MYTLSNGSLTVSILDPDADRERFGVRYCTGGYIYQVEDARLGPLLSGPTYPDSFNWFDGQGIPDAFNLAPLRDPASADPSALIIGVGVCDPAAATIQELCRWDVEPADGAITMRTRHDFQGYGFELERTVSLRGRTVRSHTALRNTGRFAGVRWFPHPFFPQLDTPELCKVNIPVRIAENPAYELAPSGYILRTGWPWDIKGHFQPLDHDAQTNLVILQRHPLLGMVAATCSYVPDFFPVWGNSNTFSWEPYLERTLASGQTLTWWIDYDF